MQPNAPVLPVAEATPNESTAEVQELPMDINFADNEDVKNQFANDIYPTIQWLIANRQGLNEEWAKNRRMDLLIHDEGRKYNGRSNAYFPSWAKANNTIISNMASGVFPSDDYLDVQAMFPDGDEDAKAMKAYMMHQVSAVSKLPSKIKPFIRERNNTGNGVIKFWYNKQPSEKKSLRTFRGDQSMGAPVYNEGIMASVRSIHNVYVYPVTAEGPQDLLLITEITQVTNGYVRQMGRMHGWKNTDLAINNRNEMMSLMEQGKLVQEKDGLTPDAMGPASGDLAVTFILESYTFMKLPKAAYLPDEDPESALPVQVFSVGTQPLVIRRNPFFHQCPPYMFSRMNVHAGSFYGTGMATIVRGLQYLTNDFANQGNDAGVFSMMPVGFMNPAFMIGPPPKLRPGALLRMTDIDKGFKFDRPPTELITAGQAMIQFYSGATADFGGAPPVLQGQSAGRGARTATGAQILQRNALQPLSDEIDDIEGDICVPYMKKGQILARQYEDRERALLIMGKPGTVNPSIFDKEYEFMWLASSQMVNQQMRAQQVMTFLQAVTPLIPYMMQLGYTFDPAPLLKKVYYDGFGFRGFDDILKRGMPMGMMQPGGQQGQQGQQTGQQSPQGQPPANVSAFPGGEQMNNPVPGEGDELQNVQTPAQELAGLLGATGGAL